MKKLVCMILSVLFLVSMLTACGGDSTPDSNTVDTPPASDGGYEEFAGDNALDAVEWAQQNFPNATPIRYANNTSTAAYESNGGAIPAVCFYLAKELPIRTEGRYRLEIYADGILASGVDDVIAGLLEGTFEMNSLTAGNWASYTDAFAEVNVPFLFTSYEQANAVLSAGLLDDMYAKAEADITGVLFRGINSLGFRQLTNNSRIIDSPDDVKGLKLRTLSDTIQIAAWEALGASVVTLPYSELYAGLQQGVVDGEENPAQNLWNDKLYEVQKYCTVTNHLYSTSCQVISKSFYDSMSTEDQQILEELLVEAEQVGLARIQEMDDSFLENCKNAGMEITYLTDEQSQEFKDAMDKVYDTCIETMGQERWDKLQEYLAAAG